MKTGLLLSLFIAASAIAQQPEPRPTPEPVEKDPEDGALVCNVFPSQVQTSIEMIEVSQAEATRILYKERLGKDGEKLRAELQKLMDEGKGAMFENLLVTTRSGQKSSAESIREVIYPTEYEAPELPSHVSVDKETAANVEKVKLLESLMTPPSPTAFETRNTGHTLEVEATVGSDDRTIDLRVVPELVFDTGRKIFHGRKDSLGNESSIEMPLFYSMRANVSLTVFDGRSQLLAVIPPKSAEGIADPSRKVFVIVRCDLIDVRPRK